MSYLDQVKDPKKNYKFGLPIVECKHEFTQNLSYKKEGRRVENIHCLECGWHKWEGVEYTRQQWENMINSPNPADPEYDKLLKVTE